MKIVIVVISLVGFLVVGSVASFDGLDLRKLSSWFYGAISFVCGLGLGLSLGSSLNESLKVGAVFVLLTLVGGVTMRWHKRRYEGMARSLVMQYGKEDNQSLFARLVRTLLGKYK